MVSQINTPDPQRLLAEADKELAKLAQEASRYADKKARVGIASAPASSPIQVEPPTSEESDVERPPLSRRTSRPIKGFMLAFLLGVAATLAWQSYGHLATESLAAYAPQLAWLHSAKEPVPPRLPEQPRSSPAPGSVVPTAELERAEASTNDAAIQAAAPADLLLQRLGAIVADMGEMRDVGRDVAELKTIVERLVAGQQAIASDLAKVQEGQEQIQRRTASPPRAVTQVRRPEPVQTTSPEASTPQSPGTLPPPRPRPPMPLR
jgi:hypothetical protein